PLPPGRRPARPADGPGPVRPGSRRLGDEKLNTSVARLAGLFDAARAAVRDPKAPRDEQLLAMRLLGRGLDRQSDDLAGLAEFLVPGTAPDVRAAAVAGLGQLRDPRVAPVLLRGWKGYGPALRAHVLDVLLRREEWAKAVLDALEGKQISPADIDT